MPKSICRVLSWIEREIRLDLQAGDPSGWHRCSPGASGVFCGTSGGGRFRRYCKVQRPSHRQLYRWNFHRRTERYDSRPQRSQQLAFPALAGCSCQRLRFSRVARKPGYTFLLQVPDASDSAVDDLIDRCAREAARLRVGLITFSSETEFQTWETKVEAPRLDTAPEALDEFIGYLSEGAKRRIARWK